MKERQQLMHKIQMVDFALMDTKLYLDTHPRDAEALCFYREHLNKAKLLKQEYEDRFGPLTAHSGADEECWNWAMTPWPWEMEA